MSASEKGLSESGRGPGHSGESVSGDGQCCPKHGRFCDEAWAAISQTLGLPPRQGEVARGVVAGQDNKEIARVLGLARETVHTYVHRLFARLGIQSRVELNSLAWDAYHAWCGDWRAPQRCPRRGTLTGFESAIG